ncbi:MAG: GTPase ObgE [Candidatus Peregrinibacteria bacterium]|nr:GTPase ObgE [Candidatus Peregrinibacteria bacterium]
MICDEVQLRCIGGKGGGGLVSFRREKFVPRGGPDGGDGGRGGNVVFRARENMRTLSNLGHIKKFKAENGGSGGDVDRHGADGVTLYIDVPTGTQILTMDKKQILADLTNEGDTYLVAKGGRGGYGNKHFVSSRFQAPKLAEIGENGEDIEVIVELKLIADVGIIGLPSAGKSTLIARVSNAKPKIAAYHFTTLSPNLGVVSLERLLKEKDASFVLADIPGLIEGAHEGKGLGHEFLKHVQRTKILIHMIDASDTDIPTSYKVINNELKKFDKNLAKKPQIVVVNKRDLIPTEEQEDFLKDIQKKLKQKKVFFISAEINDGTDELMKEVWRVLKLEEKKLEAEKEKKIEPEAAHKIFRPHLENTKNFTIKYVKKLNRQKYYDVVGKRIEQLVNMTDINTPHGMTRIRHYLKKMGIQQALTKEGAEENDVVIIAEKEIPFIKATTWKKVKK